MINMLKLWNILQNKEVLLKNKEPNLGNLKKNS